MKIVLLGTAEQKEQLLAQGQDEKAELIWLNNMGWPDDHGNADACIDLLFDDTEERIKRLRGLKNTVIIINSVIKSLDPTTSGFIRINGWNVFLKRAVIEAAVKNDELKKRADEIFSLLNKRAEWVPDIPGFITPRVIASIINEAYFALQEQVSTKEEIDTAMKLGTNYPLGPFEWCEKIGLKNIFNLLTYLSKEQKRYEPSALLMKEASS